MSIPNGIKQTISRIKAISNPQGMLDTMLNNNPQARSIVQAANGNYEKAFRDLAQQMNVDGDEIINMLRQ